MTYDHGNKKIVLFGGWIGGPVEGRSFNDTWTFDTRIGLWTQKHPAVSPPPASIGAHLAYDSANGVAVLFGDAYIDDYTWTYNVSTNTWTNMHPAPAPSCRIGHAIAYDSANGVVVLFGGNLGPYFNDTWTYDVSDNAWTEKNPALAPSPKAGFTMEYDQKNGVMVLFGGSNSSGYFNETWTYNATNDAWTQMKPPVSPSARIGHQMIYDSLLGEMVLFGGANDTECLSDMWTYNLSRNVWTQRQESIAPSARAYSGMAYDSDAGTTILFGGSGYTCFADTWSYDLKRFVSPGNFTS